MKIFVKYLLLQSLFWILVSGTLFSQTEGNGYAVFYRNGKMRFKRGQYLKAHRNFNAAKISKDKPYKSDVLEQINIAWSCYQLKIKADKYFEKKNYSEASKLYKEILKYNSYDTVVRERLKHCKEKPELNNSHKKDPLYKMIFVKGGKFIMGGKGNRSLQKAHQVYLNSFYIDKYEVTNSEFCEFLNKHSHEQKKIAKWIDLQAKTCQIEKRHENFYPKQGFGSKPVVEVSWLGAYKYAQSIGKRLATEAEWEYAATGGNRSRGHRYSGDDNYATVAWGRSNSGGHSHITGEKKSNELGIYDMSGNVYEWCYDKYDVNYYENSVKNNPSGAPYGSERVLRGGSFITVNVSVRNRNAASSDRTGSDIGFRCVKDK